MKIKYRIIIDCETSGDVSGYVEIETLSTEELKRRVSKIITEDITELIDEWECDAKFKIENIEVIK